MFRGLFKVSGRGILRAIYIRGPASLLPYGHAWIHGGGGAAGRWLSLSSSGIAGIRLLLARE